MNRLFLLLMWWMQPPASTCEYGAVASFGWSSNAPTFCIGEALVPSQLAASVTQLAPGLRRFRQDDVVYTVSLIPPSGSTRSPAEWVITNVFGERVFNSREAALQFAATQFESGTGWELCRPVPGRRTADCFKRRRARMTDQMAIEESYAVYGPAKATSTAWTLRYGKAIREGLR